VTEPEALIRLLDLEGDRQIRVFETAHPSGPEHPGPPAPLCFHPKAYVFERKDGTGVAFVGSSNLSHSALLTGIEWNYRVVAKTEAAMKTGKFETCFGVSLKGQNDCAAGAVHSCAAMSTVDYDPKSFKLVPVGTCTTMKTPTGMGTLKAM
jgi:uncharacterized membrane protein